MLFVLMPRAELHPIEWYIIQHKLAERHTKKLAMKPKGPSWIITCVTQSSADAL
jgi:hypothetical protein